MKEIEKRTLREIVHAINVIGEDYDLYVDGLDGIAICPPITITSEGENKFKEVLDTPCDWFKDSQTISYENEKLDKKAYNFIMALGGYCSSENFDKLFENGKLI